MLIKALPETKDILAMRSAQKRSFSRHPRKVDYYMANAALERARALKAAKSDKLTEKKTTAKKTTSKKAQNVKALTPRRSDIPYLEIKKYFEAGMKMKEISDKLKLTEPKKKTPYSIINNALYRLGKGVNVNGKVITIERGSK